MEKFEVVRSDNKDISILNIKGYLDAHTAPEFEKSLRNLITEKRYNIVVDLNGLQYISSAGLGVFMGFVEEIRQNSGDIKICNASQKVFKVFDLLGFPSLYEFYDSKEKAIYDFEPSKKEAEEIQNGVFNSMPSEIQVESSAIPLEWEEDIPSLVASLKCPCGGRLHLVKKHGITTTLGQFGNIKLGGKTYLVAECTCKKCNQRYFIATAPSKIQKHWIK